VNAVAPGYVETEMLGAISKEILGQIEAQIPIGRLGQPDEIARLIEFLVSEEAGFITGTTMAVNGGQFMA
jgi:acetoacetyl-CoA reductase